MTEYKNGIYINTYFTLCGEQWFENAGEEDQASKTAEEMIIRLLNSGISILPSIWIPNSMVFTGHRQNDFVLFVKDTLYAIRGICVHHINSIEQGELHNLPINTLWIDIDLIGADTHPDENQK